MVYRSDLMNWINGNCTDLDKWALIRIARYFEIIAEGGYVEIEEDIEDE